MRSAATLVCVVLFNYLLYIVYPISNGVGSTRSGLTLCGSMLAHHNLPIANVKHNTTYTHQCTCTRTYKRKRKTALNKHELFRIFGIFRFYFRSLICWFLLCSRIRLLGARVALSHTKETYKNSATQNTHKHTQTNGNTHTQTLVYALFSLLSRARALHIYIYNLRVCARENVGMYF